ncbi:hypothetical protein NDU88_005806 [Pleurodeles waltl]|uniref:Uncharacterized protein n=1 Tax=Pleurodeles waltl TaxID=8319 RepID=A0AAV7W922_PLEWA|nr:hypothetical protein NDU88_005806 [Pleurodeles waltl]
MDGGASREEALKVVRRGESLAKTYGIRKKLDQELAQQEDALNALQRQIDNGDALENESRVVHGCIGALWSRLDSYVLKDFRQRLHREGDRSGHLLALLLRRQRATPIILSLRGPTGVRILGQTCVNAHLREHLEAIYSSPLCDVGSLTREYLDGLQLSRFTDAQAAELEAELPLEDSATLLPRLLEILQELREGGLLPQQMREALIEMLPKAGRDPADPSSYRPLSMLNVHVKLLTKVLAMRLGRVVTSLVGKDQYEFAERDLERWRGVTDSLLEDSNELAGDSLEEASVG